MGWNGKNRIQSSGGGMSLARIREPQAIGCQMQDMDGLTDGRMDGWMVFALLRLYHVALMLQNPRPSIEAVQLLHLPSSRYLLS